MNVFARPILGLMGRSRTGKDTAASVLQAVTENGPQAYTLVRLAAPVKEATAALYAFDPQALEDDRKECVDPRWGVTPRQAMQHLTESVRTFAGPDHFTRLFWARYDAGQFGIRIVVPDVRFAHDIAAIHARGGIVVKLSRPRHLLSVHHACEDPIDALVGDVHLHNDATTVASFEDLVRAKFVPFQSNRT